MLKRLLSCCLIGLLCVSAYAGSGYVSVDTTVLSNGLTLISIEDHRQPVISIGLWYHVGAKDEKPGQGGFAHLFEHLMFEGSQHHREHFVKSIEAVGGYGINGVTNQDRTVYFETVPASSLDFALWLEADRMGYILGSVDQKTLDGQRAVIENERRQREDASYAVSARLIAENTYPVGHPYRKSTINESADLKAASLADIREWFETYYGAANAVIVLAGDITPATAKEKVQKYFGDIPAGRPLAHQVAWVAKMTGTHRQNVQDRVPRPRIYKVWNIPEYGSADSVYLDLISDCLGRGKSSRLYKALVSQSKIASEIRAYVQLNEIGGQFRVEVTAQPNRALAEAEKILDDELADFLKNGPAPEELERIKAQYLSDYYRNMDRLGGLGSRSDRLAQSVLFGRGDGAVGLAVDRVQNATAEELRTAARKWLSDGVYVLNVVPFGFGKSGKQTLALNAPPLEPPSKAKIPSLRRMTLSNGLKVALFERHETPLVNLWMSFDAGSAADPCDLPGVASMTLRLMDAATTTRSGSYIEERFSSLGSELRAETNFDQSVIKLSTLKSSLAESVDLFSDVLLHPTFPSSEFDLQQKQALAAVEREENTPMYLALRALPKLLYKPGCSSANPFTGSGTAASVQRMAREDLIGFHNAWFRPNNATLIVAGDVSPAEIKPILERAFSSWKPAPVPSKNSASALAADLQRPGVYLIDRPGAIQSFIVAASMGMSKTDPEELAAQVINDALGGNLSSRLNLNLREEKHWSYGMRSQFWAMRGPRPFLTYGAFQSDKTADAISEIRREFFDIQSRRPVVNQELTDIKNSQTLRLPASLETLDSVAEWITRLIQFDLPEEYFISLQNRIAALTANQVEEAARSFIHPDRMLWIVVGDKAKIESSLREAGMVDIWTVELRRQP
jgi:zinc protease